MTDREEILSRFTSLQVRLNEASGKWGGVGILPVTKTVPAERILYLREAGVREIGENRVQEAMEKHPLLKDHFAFRIIGRLQTNKARYIADFAKSVDSLDRIELAEALEKAMAKKDRQLEVLIEVNIGKDPAKGGINPEDTLAFLKSMRAYEHLSVRGLMTVAPIVNEPEEARVYFRSMRRLFDEAHAFDKNIEILSMGMSKDCFVAAEEGATVVRVGSGIFGARVYA